ncbi:hypothetical protein M569_02223 [Genlisea aurea]|uniref:Dof zinc finger protein n=1 Tax=Genlisea aurea TaxID=192259 RepID=S8D551_9LAMI|nr:hypothetical protein M569_02223 [Genlisea aurea]
MDTAISDEKPARIMAARPPPPPPRDCPRCNSPNTKFCYYNNQSFSQPRYFCKSCRRFWTQGGTLRNVPVGGGSRKIKEKKTPPPCDSPFSPAIPFVGLAAPSHLISPVGGSSSYAVGGCYSSLSAFNYGTARYPTANGGGNTPSPPVNFGRYAPNMSLSQGGFQQHYSVGHQQRSFHLASGGASSSTAVVGGHYYAAPKSEWPEYYPDFSRHS